MDDFESGKFITLSIYDLLTPQKVNFKNHVLTLFFTTSHDTYDSHFNIFQLF